MPNRLFSLILLGALGAVVPAAARAEPTDDEAVALFSAAFATSCLGGFLEDGSLVEPPQRFQTSMASSYGEPEPAVLWQFFCESGAYNLSSVFLIWTEFDGLRPLALPMPWLKVVYENPDAQDSPLKEIGVESWSATLRAINAAFDPATGELTAVSRWRGIGDAYDAATWVLRDGGAHLKAFEADATYDEEIKPQLTLTFP